MNAQKEAEYIAEIVRLKRELAASKNSGCNSPFIAATNKELLSLANTCIEQIESNTGNRVGFTLPVAVNTQMSTGENVYYHTLKAKVTTTTTI